MYMYNHKSAFFSSPKSIHSWLNIKLISIPGVGFEECDESFHGSRARIVYDFWTLSFFEKFQRRVSLDGNSRYLMNRGINTSDNQIFISRYQISQLLINWCKIFASQYINYLPMSTPWGVKFEQNIFLTILDQIIKVFESNYLN